MQAKKINISQCAFSGITRMELLSFPGITENEEQAIESLLDRMTHLSVSPIIEDLTIQFRRQHQTKLPERLLLQQQKPMPLSC
ncbi:DNA-binding protein [Methylobacter tundripaludum]|nr:DNA-binding protein [Methylobacter tundripaludum]